MSEEVSSNQDMTVSDPMNLNVNVNVNVDNLNADPVLLRIKDVDEDDHHQWASSLTSALGGDDHDGHASSAVNVLAGVDMDANNLQQVQLGHVHGHGFGHGQNRTHDVAVANAVASAAANASHQHQQHLSRRFVLSQASEHIQQHQNMHEHVLQDPIILEDLNANHHIHVHGHSAISSAAHAHAHLHGQISTHAHSHVNVLPVADPMAAATGFEHPAVQQFRLSLDQGFHRGHHMDFLNFDTNIGHSGNALQQDRPGASAAGTSSHSNINSNVGAGGGAGIGEKSMHLMASQQQQTQQQSRAAHAQQLSRSTAYQTKQYLTQSQQQAQQQFQAQTQTLPQPQPQTESQYTTTSTNNNFSSTASGRVRKDFDYRLKEVKRFKIKFGHCMIPHKFPENPSLGTWVDTQRRRYRKYLKVKAQSNSKKRTSDDCNYSAEKRVGFHQMCMSEDQVQKLLDIGFVFEPRMSREDTWQRRVEELQVYKDNHGHCNVREDDMSVPGLGKWVSYVRRSNRLAKAGKRAKKLSKEKQIQLEKMGFIFELKEEMALKRFRDGVKSLQEFLDSHGHMVVPNFYEPNPTLGLCVEDMRVEYRKICEQIISGGEGYSAIMSKEIVKELASMGFLAEEGVYPATLSVYPGRAAPIPLMDAEAADGMGHASHSVLLNEGSALTMGIGEGHGGTSLVGNAEIHQQHASLGHNNQLELGGDVHQQHYATLPFDNIQDTPDNN